MAVAANKRSVMTLFSGANDMFSHQVRIVLAEKGVSVDICQVDPSNLPDELAELKPYNTVPTLVDRELALYTSRISMMMREVYNASSRSTRVGTVLYGFSSASSSGRLAGSTWQISTLTPFSARTIRT